MFKKLLGTILLAYATTFSAAAVAQVIGYVHEVKGLAGIRDQGREANAVAGATFQQGAAFVTGPDGQLTLKFEDGQVITLGPNTRFVATTYAFNKAKVAESNVAFRLISGTLRSISGMIAATNPQKVAISTTTATIGVRGTVITISDTSPTDEPTFEPDEPPAKSGSAPRRPQTGFGGSPRFADGPAVGGDRIGGFDRGFGGRLVPVSWNGSGSFLGRAGDAARLDAGEADDDADASGNSLLAQALRMPLRPSFTPRQPLQARGARNVVASSEQGALALTINGVTVTVNAGNTTFSVGGAPPTAPQPTATANVPPVLAQAFALARAVAISPAANNTPVNVALVAQAVRAAAAVQSLPANATPQQRTAAENAAKLAVDAAIAGNQAVINAVVAGGGVPPAPLPATIPTSNVPGTVSGGPTAAPLTSQEVQLLTPPVTITVPSVQ